MVAVPTSSIRAAITFAMAAAIAGLSIGCDGGSPTQGGNPTPPVTPPVPQITDVAVRVNLDSAIIDYTLSVSGKLRFGYTVQGSGSTCTFAPVFESSTSATTQRIVLTGLIPDTGYVTCADANNQAGYGYLHSESFRSAVLPPVTLPADLVFTRLYIYSNADCSTAGPSSCQFDIVVRGTDGVEHNLTNTPNAHDFHPTWSPDGKQIAFVSDRDLFEQQLYIMNADGSNVRKITTVSANNPRWSPDGSRLAFVSKASAPSSFATGPLCIVNASGAGLTCPVASATGRVDWSPDGSRIAYNTLNYVCVFTLATSMQKCGPRLAINAAGLGPQWSPDGNWLAFSGDSSAVVHSDKLYIMRPDGTDQHRVTGALDKEYELNPEWSPNGSEILFTRSVDEGFSGYHVNRVTVANGQFTRVTNDGVHPDAGYDWSPQSMIVFSAAGPGYPVHRGLWVVRLDGLGLARLTAVTGRDLFPEWRPH
jgi:Tol biopolymer transport system component